MRDRKAADNAHGGHTGRPLGAPHSWRPSFNRVAPRFGCGLGAAWGPPRPRAMPFALGTNTLKFLDIFAGKILALVRGTIGALPRLGRQEVLRPGRTEGYTTWPDPTGRERFFRTRPVDRPPRGARGRYLLGARHRARSGRGTRPVPIPSSQRPLTRACESKDHSSATVWS